MRVGSLFSGIGGMDLGLEQAGMRIVRQSEIDPYARAVLRKQWPHAKLYGDLCNLGKHNLEPVDLICGGFPCQDISNAGNRRGIEGPHSGLWKEFARIIKELKPPWALIENVSALRSRGLEVVLQDLSASGYDAEWDCIPAAAVGAPHQRDRLFILAYPVRSRFQGAYGPEGREYLRPIAPALRRQWDTEPLLDRVANGIPKRVDRLRCLGNAVVPQVAETVGRMIMRFK